MIVESSEPILSQMRKGVLEYCLLAQLRNTPSYGLGLVSALGRHPALLTSEGTLYPLLARLRRQGLVTTEWRESPEGPPRRYYVLTTAGDQALAAFTASWSEFKRAVDTVIGATE